MIPHNLLFLDWLAAPATTPGMSAASGRQNVLLWVIVTLLVLIILALLAYLFWRSKHPKSLEAKKHPRPIEDAGKETSAELRQSFGAALATQRSLVQGRDFRYRLPWFLLLGAEGAGKSSLLSESSLAGSLEERVGVEPGTGTAWNFLGNAVVVDTGGWMLTTNETPSATWNRLLRLFKNARPERPLDGLVLTMSAEDLVGDKALDPSQIIERGALIQLRMRRLTQVLGFQLPLYLVVTKCDALEGFRPFAGAMEPEELNGIFGWSNPYSDRLQFQADWVDEAVNAMRVTAERVQSRLFAGHEAGPGREAMFLFPGSLYAMLAPLRLLLSRALRGGGDAPAPLLRGIYCAGATGGQFAPAERTSQLVPVSQPSDGFSRDAAHSYEQDQSVLKISPALAQSALQSRLGVAFVQDLFLEKIFPEHNLGRPLEQFFASRDKLRTWLQIASASLALLLTVGTAVSYHRLTRDTDRLQNLLGGIYHELTTPAVYTVDPTQVDTRAGASDLLDTLATFESGGFRSVFLPASWFSSLPGSVRATIVQAFQQLILARFYGGLNARAGWLGDPSQMPLKAADLPSSAPGGSPVTALEGTPDYLQMQAFLDDVHKLDQNIVLYNGLCTSNSTGPLQSIVQLDGYLHNRPENATVSQASNPYFQQAIDDASYRCFTYTPQLNHAITSKAEALINNLDAAWIAHNPVRGATDTLVDDFNRISTPGSVDASDVGRISGHLRAAQTVYAAPELHWVSVAPIAVPANLARVTADVAEGSPFFETGLRLKTASLADGYLSQLLSALSGAETALTGPVTDSSSGQLALSAGSLEVQSALDALEKASFVSGAGGGAMSLEVTHPAGILWDRTALDTASALPVAYGKFTSDALSKSRAPVRIAVGRIAAAAAAASLESALLSAEHPSGAGEAFAEAQAFNDALPSITGLLASMAQYGLTAPLLQMRGVAVHQASGVLADLNAGLMRAQPYEVGAVVYSRWTAGAPSAALFGASSADALTGYLSAQHDEIARLNASAAPAVRFLEENRSYVPGNAGRLLTQWEGIGAALEGYAAKKPGNSVAALEGLISTQLDKVVPGNGCALPDTTRTGHLDYFTLTASDLSQRLQLRCQYLLNQTFDAAYTRLADVFDHTLAERFPFGPLSSLPLAEADPAAITGTYQLYDSAADLFHSPRAAMAPPAAQMFLSRFDAARPWFAPLLSAGNDGTVTLEVIPSFRVERAREVGGDQIIDWSLGIGATTVHAGDPPAKLPWNLGDPVLLSLRWAKDSPVLPAPRYPADENTGALKSNGETVSWKFSDAWSLLRFLRTFERTDAAGHAAAKIPGEEAFLLEFDVPVLPASARTAGPQTAPVTTATVFLRLLISAPGQKSALPRDHFPELAPPLLASPTHATANAGEGDTR